MIDDPVFQQARLSPAVLKHVRRLGRWSSVRLFAERHCAADELSEMDFHTLLAAVCETSAARWRDRLVAAACLGTCSLTAEQRGRASAVLRSALTDPKLADTGCRWIRLYVPFVLCGSVLVGLRIVQHPGHAVVIHLADSQLSIPTGWFSGGLVFTLMQLYPAMFLHYKWEYANVRRSMEEAVRSLGKLADPIAVGILARIQSRRRGVVSINAALARAAYEALPAALASVREEHYGVLAPEATPALCDALNPLDPSLSIAILEALGRAGSGSAAGRIQSFIPLTLEHSPITQTEAEQELEDRMLSVARSVLPILEERLRNETSAARLLRPAESPANPADILLRPAGSATSVPEEQLLRAAAPDEIVRAEHVE